jgi:predicted hotdog family 3-hydroxylacyl-ACP dehydratase
VLIDKSAIARLIPHAGAMCLLDGVLSWDEARVCCTAGSHRSPDNPLRRNGQLGILCGVEYAAQTMALHGALLSGNPSLSGYLASIRTVRCHADRLDLMQGDLRVEAEHLHGDAGRAIYRFRLCYADRVLLDGRAAVVLAEAVT